MREIKFRAWDKRTNHMFYKEFFEYNWLPLILDSETKPLHIGFSDKPHIELMQYTGLKDKNGVEIYEGDVLSSIDSPIPLTAVRSLPVTKVFWDNASFALIDSEGCFRHSAEYHVVSALEVIGNIYENPELVA